MNRNLKIEITKVANGFVVNTSKEVYVNEEHYDYENQKEVRIYEDRDKLIEFISSFLR